MANPTGPPGTFTQTFEDTFDGTTLDTSKWTNLDGYTMNSVTARAANVSVSGGYLRLKLSSNTDGAYISTNVNSVAGQGYLLPVGGVTEARILFPGTGSKIYNWGAWWASGGNYPANGENDIAEVLGAGVLNSVYHYGAAGTAAQTTGPYAYPSYTGDTFHVYTLHRKASTCDVYLDGTLIKTYSTQDAGGGQSLLLNVGYSDPAYGGVNQTGDAGAMQVDYVRAWSPASAGTATFTYDVTAAPASSTSGTAMFTYDVTAPAGSTSGTATFTYDVVQASQSGTATFTYDVVGKRTGGWGVFANVKPPKTADPITDEITDRIGG